MLLVRNEMARMHLANTLRLARRAVRRTPMHRVLRELEAMGVRLERLIALEIFGGTGRIHTKDYASRVASLEVWEIDPRAESELRRNLPGATIKITDAYDEIVKTTRKYSLIVVDNPTSTFSADCEHFGLFPKVLRIAMDSSVLVVNVIPEVGEVSKQLYPCLFNEAQLERRAAFYQTRSPEKVPVPEMVKAYRHLLHLHGFHLKDWFSMKRTSYIHYLVLQIEREG